MSRLRDFLLSEWQKRAAEDDGWIPQTQQHFPLDVFCLSVLKRLHSFKDAAHLMNEAGSFFPQFLGIHAKSPGR